MSEITYDLIRVDFICLSHVRALKTPGTMNCPGSRPFIHFDKGKRNSGRQVILLCGAAAADILLTPPPPIITDRRAAAAAADRMSASRRRRFCDLFTSRCTPGLNTQVAKGQRSMSQRHVTYPVKIARTQYCLVESSSRGRPPNEWGT